MRPRRASTSPTVIPLLQAVCSAAPPTSCTPRPGRRSTPARAIPSGRSASTPWVAGTWPRRRVSPALTCARCRRTTSSTAPRRARITNGTSRRPDPSTDNPSGEAKPRGAHRCPRCERRADVVGVRALRRQHGEDGAAPRRATRPARVRRRPARVPDLHRRPGRAIRTLVAGETARTVPRDQSRADDLVRLRP